jgi:hypothetical protein
MFAPDGFPDDVETLLSEPHFSLLLSSTDIISRAAGARALRDRSRLGFRLAAVVDADDDAFIY